MTPFNGDRSLSAASEFDRASLLFQHGELSASQELAQTLANQFETANPHWSARFRILSARSAAWRGMNPDVLRALLFRFPSVVDSEISIQRLSLMGLAHAHLHQFDLATRDFAQAQTMCSLRDEAACGELLRARGGFAVERGQFREASELFSQSLSSARRYGQRWDEAAALMNLGATSLREEKYDEAIDWLHASARIANQLYARDILVNIDGNQGWAYYRLGDSERALEMFKQAEQGSVALGDAGDAVGWLTTAGDVYESTGDFNRAAQSYKRAFDLAKQIESKEDIVDTLEDLAHVSLDAGKPEDASAYVEQVTPLVRANGNPLDSLDVLLAQGRIAAARRHNTEAEAIFRSVENDPSSQTSMRLGAQHELAGLYESKGDMAAADRMYKTTLASFESARAQLQNEDSKLPFFANATRIYDDYIHFLVSQGRTDEALAVADGSRARTLAQGLGIDINIQSFKPAALHPGAIAQKSRATLLFYWLGQKQSYVWAITSNKTELFPLPAQSEITALVDRYSKAVSQLDDTLNSANEDGLALYQTLIAPVGHLIRPGSTVVLLNDGALSRLNFETLIVPGAKPHYWIEDATLISAPSIYMLASAQHPAHTGRKLLLLGDAISPDPDYSELPKAAFEMRQIERHFAAADQTVFARKQATSAAYITSELKQFSYIHFVAHGVASRTDPLDSAIILSRLSNDADSFKLYAREIIQHPIRAQLVTISACSGSGSRSYVGEGMVGLSWAFLRAGAHNVIGALWEVSDDSTPRLMDALYQSLDDGMSPSAALRQAKLTLLHSEGGFRRPFFWASFQIYAGL